MGVIFLSLMNHRGKIVSNTMNDSDNNWLSLLGFPHEKLWLPNKFLLNLSNIPEQRMFHQTQCNG